jgi:hypothetical protein
MILMKRVFFERIPIQYFSSFHHGTQKSFAQLLDGYGGAICRKRPCGANCNWQLVNGSMYRFMSFSLGSNQWDMSCPATSTIGLSNTLPKGKEKKNPEKQIKPKKKNRNEWIFACLHSLQPMA